MNLSLEKIKKMEQKKDDLLRTKIKIKWSKKKKTYTLENTTKR